MPRTISDEEYNFLTNKRMTADFVESIYNDPDLNKEAKRLIKKKYPNLAIPDYDLEQKVEQRFSAEDERKQKEAAEPGGQGRPRRLEPPAGPRSRSNTASPTRG